MFPIGCFCWTKTQWDSGHFKEAVSLFCYLQDIICLVLITSHFIDESLLFWWNHLMLMGPFCVINIWMESENTSAIQKAIVSSFTVCAIAKGSLNSLLGNKETVISAIKLSYAMLWCCLGLIQIFYMINSSNSIVTTKYIHLVTVVFPLIVWTDASTHVLNCSCQSRIFGFYLQLQKNVRHKSPSKPQTWSFHLYRLVRANVFSFVLRCWIDPERLKILTWLSVLLCCGEGGQCTFLTAGAVFTHRPRHTTSSSRDS